MRFAPMIDWLIGRAAAYTINVPISGTKREYSSFGEYVTDLINYAINIGAALAVLVVLFGAFKYATSAGDEAKAKDAKDIIIGALIGFALLILIRVITPILGIGDAP